MDLHGAEKEVPVCLDGGRVALLGDGELGARCCIRDIAGGGIPVAVIRPGGEVYVVG